LQAGDHRCFRRIFAGTAFPFCRRLGANGDWQNALHGRTRAGEREFADDDKMIELSVSFVARGEHPDGDGRSKLGPSFFTSAGAR